MIEKVDAPLTLGQNITLGNDSTMTVIDKQHYGRAFVVKDEGIYTVRLGVFHNMNKHALEEAAIFCAIPQRAACDQQIIAAFDIPQASTRFLDTVILKATRPFLIKPIPGSLILERHGDPWGIPLKYDSVREGNILILTRTGLRENVLSQYKTYFDVLGVQIEIIFVN